MLNRLSRQWLLQSPEVIEPEGAVCVHSQDGWALYAERKLVCHPKSGSKAAVAVCGVATDARDPKASLADIAYRLSELDTAALEQALEDVVGCYVVFVWSGGCCTVLTDPASAIGVYYDPAVGRVASSPSLVGEYCRDPRTSGWFGARPSNDWLPSPYTIFERLRVLPANHALDTSTWEVRRFWPNEIEDRERPDAPDLIAADLCSVMESVARDDRELHLSLTGGHDSRANLAAARTVREHMQFFTLRNAGVSSADIVLARQVAEAAGIPLRVIDCPPPTQRQLEEYDLQCGYQAFGARRDIVGGCALVANGPAIHINGGLGVLLKNFYGARLGPRSQPVRVQELLTDFDRPPKLVVEGVSQWLASVDGFPPQLQRTLMYLEQRAPRWMGPADLASSLYYDPFSPYCSRRIALAAAFAPDELLEGGQLHKAVISQLWPELLGVPFTKPRSALRRALPRGLKERLRPFKKLLDSGRNMH